MTAWGEGPCPPAEFQRLDLRRQFWGQMGWTLVLAGVALLTLLPLWVLLVPLGLYGDLQWLLVFPAGLSCAVVGCWAKARGRSAAWGLLGLSCLPGILVVAFLPRCCGWCGRPGGRKPGTCADCGGPL